MAPSSRLFLFVLLCTACGPGLVSSDPPESDLTEFESSLSSTLVAAADTELTNVTGTPNGDASLFRNVSEAVADDDTSFVKMKTGATAAAHGMAWSGGGAGLVTQVRATWRARRGWGEGTAQLELYDGATLLTTGTEQPLTDTWTDFTDTFSGLQVASTAQLRTRMVFRSGAGGGMRYTRLSLAAVTRIWVWDMSGIWGGGFAQVVAADPFNAGFATLGGDSWGVYKTRDRGNSWRPATRNNPGTDGDFFFVAVAYSRKFPGTVYGLTGRFTAASGGFWAITGDVNELRSRAVNGAEPSLARQDRPRPTGNRLLVDFDAASGTEYLYVGAGEGRGVQRSIDGGRTWQPLGVTNHVITGMALDPTDATRLLVGTRDGAFRLDDVRGRARQVALTSGVPPRIEELAVVGGTVFAAANTSGIYKVTNHGTTWVKKGQGVIPAASQWATVGGAGATVYVGCADPVDGKSIFKSIDGGETWFPVTNDPTKVSLQVWGSTQDFWLGAALSRTMINGNSYEAGQIAVDLFNPDIVYVAGRSGAWKSEDGGNTWRPAMRGLGGTMHTNIAAGPGGSVASVVEDWNFVESNDYAYSVQIGPRRSYGPITLDLNKNGHRYQVVSTAQPLDFLVDGVSVADDYFRTACIRPTDIDVSDSGDVIYVAQFGGGVLVGHRVPWPVK